jgi:hypothetical protein
MDRLIPGPYDSIQGPQTVRLNELLRKSPLAALELWHPSVIKRILLIWGTPEMDLFFERLATDVDFAGATLNGAELDEVSLLAQVHRMRAMMFGTPTR